MLVNSHRFGTVEVSESDVIRFPEGLVGLTSFRQFVMLRDPESENLIWLQSAENADFSLATMHSSILGTGYNVEIRADEVASIQLERHEDAEVFVIINRIEGEFFANLRGPLIINTEKMLGKQVVLRNTNYLVRHPFTTDPEGSTGAQAGKSAAAQISISARS